MHTIDVRHLCEMSWHATAVITYLLHTVEFMYFYIDLVCAVPLFHFIFNLFHITTRQLYMKNHAIHCNTSGAVDSLNTQHCLLLKHCIISQAHFKSMQCFSRMQYLIAAMSLVSDPFTSVLLASKTFCPRQFASQSPIHLHLRHSSKTWASETFTSKTLVPKTLASRD